MHISYFSPTNEFNCLYLIFNNILSLTPYLLLSGRWILFLRKTRLLSEESMYYYYFTKVISQQVAVQVEQKE